MQSSDELAIIDHTIREGGIPAVLRLLNARTPHRFTGIFKFDAEQLHNLYLFDREDSAGLPWGAFPVTNSFCSIIRDTNESFTLANATTDPRVTEHPARHKIISYCGVPLHYENGELYGSICHFDYRPLVVPDLDLHYLRSAAPLLMRALLQ